MAVQTPRSGIDPEQPFINSHKKNIFRKKLIQFIFNRMNAFHIFFIK